MSTMLIVARRRSLLAPLAIALLAALVVLAPARPSAAQHMPAADIVDTAVAAGEFTTLAAALEAAGLVDTLKGPGPFTVFAPTDAAFAAVPAEVLDALLADPEQLRAVLTYHVVAGQVTAADVVGLESAPTVQGESVGIGVMDGMVVLNGASTVVAADVAASNGVIHVIDTVLLPPSLLAAE